MNFVNSLEWKIPPNKDIKGGGKKPSRLMTAETLKGEDQMAYTVFIYKDCAVQSQESFDNIQKAFEYLGQLDLKTDVERCILDNGTKILFNLIRDEDGNLTSNRNKRTMGSCLDQ